MIVTAAAAATELRGAEFFGEGHFGGLERDFGGGFGSL